MELVNVLFSERIRNFCLRKRFDSMLLKIEKEIFFYIIFLEEFVKNMTEQWKKVEKNAFEIQIFLKNILLIFYFSKRIISRKERSKIRRR
jgi:protein-S-isoprenylcysteine O-methyltransferase Ste14